jgi:hypothetical protein
MDENKELQRTITWIETWTTQHATTRAAQKIAVLLDAYKVLQSEHTAVEADVPNAENAERYVQLRDEVLSRIPPGSVWETSIADPGELVTNFVQHLYYSHTLGCVECFGGSHRV